MSPLAIVLLVVLLLLAIGGMPAMGFHTYGWTPSVLLVVVLIFVLVLALTGRL